MVIHGPVDYKSTCSPTVSCCNGLFQDLYIGLLVPWMHYVLARIDYSDREERLEWLAENDGKAKHIAINAQRLVKRWGTRRQFECYIGRGIWEFACAVSKFEHIHKSNNGRCIFRRF
ncbi:hypothetical protein BC830DRAFT_1114382 [Chytriomyces sp. MP71]|nr:hypothetical protein BC830DRAFT_1114382 [Chytriomyces sp. MP71]